ncbi:MAG: hypothetical protein FD177_853 [Desulfovibrionaceae bacterium]|nr:MAG: hypothetical protein FD177_853 [Desulfovibrionaceae bacterium]
MRRSSLLFSLASVFIVAFTLSPFVCTQAAEDKAAPTVSSDPPKANSNHPQSLPTTKHDPMPEGLLKGIITTMYILIALGFIGTWKSLHSDKYWSMARALSENTVVEQQDPADATKKTSVVIDLPSSSRLIAFIGLIVLMVTFLTLGAVMIWTLGRTGQIISMENAQNYLLAGMSMFAPYLFNQGKEALKAFGKPGA